MPKIGGDLVILRKGGDGNLPSSYAIGDDDSWISISSSLVGGRGS